MACDLGIGQAFGDEQEYLAFAGRQLAQFRGLLGPGRRGLVGQDESRKQAPTARTWARGNGH